MKDKVFLRNENSSFHFTQFFLISSTGISCVTYPTLRNTAICKVTQFSLCIAVSINTKSIPQYFSKAC